MTKINESTQIPDDANPDLSVGPIPAPTKTPFYQATNALRYQRQAIIKELHGKTGRIVICYVAGINAPIDRDDTVIFVDLLHNVPQDSKIDLLLHTGGGDIDAAEKLITMLRKRAGQSELRLIVPDFAKSAGTLIALGTDAIVMSDTSELGPIDPQLHLPNGAGGYSWQPVQSFLDAFAFHSKALELNPNNLTSALMLDKLHPALIKQCETVRTRAQRFAEKHLRLGMFRGTEKNVTLTATQLLDTATWLSHGQMISWEDAKDPKLDLNVLYLPPDNAIWQEYWRLYCMQRLATGAGQKLFESSYASILMGE